MIFEMRGHIGRDLSLIGHFGKADFADREACAVSRTLRVPQVAKIFPHARPDSVFRWIKLWELGGSANGERIHFPLRQNNKIKNIMCVLVYKRKR